MSKELLVAQFKSEILAGQDAALQGGLEKLHDGAFAEGVASVPPADADEQAKIDAAVAAAVGPLNEQIAALTAQDASDVQALNDAKAAADAAKAQFDATVANMKVQIDAALAGKADAEGKFAGLQEAADKLQAFVDEIHKLFPIPAP